jgi:hypothetical protein
VRRRYRRAGYVGALVTVFLAAAYLVPSVYGGQPDPVGGLEGRRLGGVLATLLAAALIPPLVARAAWRLHRRRYLADIYLLTVI